jgi:hypothetical protein
MCAVANSFPNFKGLSQDGERADFFKTLRASLFNIGLISARSISLDRTFNKGCLSRQIIVIAGNGSTVH